MHPEWMLNTPRIGYSLAAADLNLSDHPFQEIELTVEEYDALKRHLADLRGCGRCPSPKRPFVVSTPAGLLQ
ncbi:MAG: hypothetical protein JWN34_2858 [Bryobacterales bacterium]|nr:hypothetical protein [Bryobacterales bacterium]